MKKLKKLRWDNICKDIIGLILIIVAIVVIVGSCGKTEASSEPGPVKKYFDVPILITHQDHIFNLCEKYEIAPEIVIAIIERESNYDASAVGDNGESAGLMQIQEHNHYDRIERLGVTNLFDPIDNVEVGVDYLAHCIERNGGNIEMALMSYNAGQKGANENYFSKGIYSNAYSQNVLEIAQRLKEGMIEMPYTDDPYADFDRHDAEQQAALDRLPKCSYCDEPIQDDYLYEINDEVICEDCIKDNFRKKVEDYIE